MVKIPKASESESDGFQIPAAGTYTAIVQEITPEQVSQQSGKLEQVFKWELLSMYDDDQEEWVQEFPDKGAVLFDYVNVESFYDGGGDPSKISKLYKIAKAIRGPELDPEDAGDTDDFRGAKVLLELEQGKKKMGPNAGQPKAVIMAYKYIKRKKAQAKPDVEQPAPEYDDVEDIPF